MQLSRFKASQWKIVGLCKYVLIKSSTSDHAPRSGQVQPVTAGDASRNNKEYRHFMDFTAFKGSSSTQGSKRAVISSSSAEERRLVGEGGETRNLTPMP